MFEGLRNQPKFFSDFVSLLLPKPEQINFGQVKSYAERKNLLAETKNASKKFAPMYW